VVNFPGNEKSMHDVSDEEVAAFKASGDFDERWYLAEYPDVSMTGLDPARHFLWIGRRLNRKPAPGGQPAAVSQGDNTFAEFPPDVAAASPPASTRSSALGATLGFAKRLGEKAKQQSHRRSKKIPANVLDVVEQGFDSDFYLTKYPDIAAAGVDPLEHYMLNGWLEGRDPCLDFSTGYYLENNPDVAAANVNPFYHFLSSGAAEGRAGQHKLGFRWDILSKLRPVSDQIAQHKAYRSPVPRTSRSDLNAALQRGIPGKKAVILSFSHDDYTSNVGGVQILLRRELEMLQERDYLQIHLYPIHPLPFLDTSDEKIQLGVLINGTNVGNFNADDIVSCLERMDKSKHRSLFVIHSLLGHNMDQTIAILKAAGIKKDGGNISGFLWLHDYSPLYNNYKLLRNDVEYRGIPREGTVAWELCEFARAEFSHRAEFAKLLQAFDVELLSPSKAALAIWEDANLLKPHRSRVVEHVTLRPVASKPPSTRHSTGPLKVGFLGYPSEHKGWPVFQQLVLGLKGDARYEFYHLGKARQGGLPVEFREVIASGVEPDLMRRAVSALELDVVLAWSIWPETFCLTAYEAVAGGAVLVTNPCAGNIVDLAKQTGEGLVLADEAALRSAFESGSIMKQARARRTVRQFELDYSPLTLEALD
jgi:hypothetical protein